MTDITTLDQQIRARARRESEKEVDKALNDFINRFVNSGYEKFYFDVEKHGNSIDIAKDEAGGVKTVGITIDLMIKGLKAYCKQRYGDKCEQRAVEQFVSQVDALMSQFDERA